MRLSYLIWGLVVVIVGTFHFVVTNEVATRERQLARLQAAIVKTSEDIHVLRAEWTYLNAPGRLETLANTHLALKPVHPTQYRTIDDIPYPPGEEPPEAGDIDILPAPDGGYTLADETDPTAFKRGILPTSAGVP